MTLQAWQDSLAELVISGGASAHASACTNLSASERKWLSRLPTCPGFRMTCTVQRWWRKLAVEESAPLVLALLTSYDQRDRLTGYLDGHFEASLFPLMEALHFLEFVLDHPPDLPHLEAVAAFEVGLLRLTWAAALSEIPTGETCAVQPGVPVARHPLARMVRFSLPPHEVLGAILAGCRPPDGSEEHWLLLAPRLPNLSRLATADEAHVFETLQHRTAYDVHAFGALWQAGALTPTHRL